MARTQKATSASDRTVVFPKWERKERIYLLMGDATPISEQIQSRHTKYNALQYFDEKEGYPRSLRYVTNQTTFFEDEQVEPFVLGGVVFEDGKLVVKANETVLQQFLAIHPHNKANGGKKFYEFDPESAAQEDLKKELAGYEAVAVALELAVEDYEAIGRVLWGPTIDNLTSGELKRDIIRHAKKDPVEFLKLANNSDIKMINLAQRAIDLNLIKINDDGVTVSWVVNGKEITKLPFSTKPIETLAQWLKTDEGLKLQEGLSLKIK